MWSLIRREPQSARLDPAPSRWSWRLQRLMLTPGIRFGLRAGIPFVATFAAATIWLSDADRRAIIETAIADVRASIENRPEFMVTLMTINGAEPDLQRDIRAALPLDFPVSSFDLELDQMRGTIAALPPVKQASVRVRPGGVLLVEVTPRVPVAIWRSREGLALVDEVGAVVSPIERRDQRPDLPVIAGDGANTHVAQALELIETAQPLGNRLRGIVRMGERRWDVVLDREQRILLPADDPRRALERVIALEGAEDVLSRDVARVDMRLMSRPTVQMNKAATEEWWRIRQLSGQ